MSHPALPDLDKRRKRLLRLDVSLAEIHLSLRPRWVGFQQAREHRSNWGPAVSEPGLERLLDYTLHHDGPLLQRGLAALPAMRRALDADDEAAFRQGPGRPLAAQHQPVPPEMIEKSLQRFFDWMKAPSFAELHPVVQMSLAQARLMEIQPFAQPCEALATAFAASFVMESGFLLPVPEASAVDRFPTALEEAFQLSTASLVQFNLEAALQSYAVVERLLGR